MTSRAWPGLVLYRGDEPGGTRKRQSVTPQSDRFKLGRPGHVGLSGPGPLYFQSSSVLAVGRRLGCRGISVTTLQKVTGVLSFPRNVTSGQSRPGLKAVTVGSSRHELAAVTSRLVDITAGIPNPRRESCQ